MEKAHHMCQASDMSDDDRYRRFNLRIPKDTFERLQASADARSHSMNAEIVQRLEASLPTEDQEAARQSFEIEELNVLVAAISHEREMLDYMINKQHLLATPPKEGAIDFQKMRLAALEARYAIMAAAQGFKVDPNDVLKLVWD